MTRAYAAKRLLEHGPLTFPEFWSITGWSMEEAREVLAELQRERVIALVYESNSNPRYWLR